MRKPLEFMLWGLTGLFLLVVAAYLTLYFVAQNRREAALARLPQPTSPVARSLLAKISQEPAPAPDAGVASDAGEAESSPYMRLAKDVVARLLTDNAMWEPIRDLIAEAKGPLSEEARCAVETLVEANQDLVAATRNTRAAGPVVNIENADLSMLLRMDCTYLGFLRNLARLLQMDILVRGSAGDLALAVDDILAGLRLRDALVADAYFTPSQRSGLAVQQIMIEAIRDGLAPGSLSHEQTLRLVDAAGAVDYRRAYAGTLALEIPLVVAGFSDSLANGPVQGRILYTVARPWFDLDLSTYADLTGQFAVLAERPYYETVEEGAALQRAIDTQQGWILSWRTWINPYVLEVPAQYEATSDLLRMGLLLELYYSERGEYPATLDAIAPDLGRRVPVDPFTGEAYHYAPAGATFTLYSVGQNGADDGGVQGRRRDEGDIVWRGRAEE